jgi:nitrous oxide reductase accessory protein NosL
MTDTCNCHWHPDRESWLDALALCWLLGIGDSEGFSAILASYLTNQDATRLLIAMAHVSIDAMNAVAVATDRTTESVLGGARDWVISHG